MQTPSCLWRLTLSCDLDLKPRSKRLISINICRLLYCTLVPGVMSGSLLVCEIWPLVHFCDLWPLPVTFIVRQGHFHFFIRCMLCCCVLVPSTKIVGSKEFEVLLKTCKTLTFQQNYELATWKWSSWYFKLDNIT